MKNFQILLVILLIFVFTLLLSGCANSFTDQPDPIPTRGESAPGFSATEEGHTLPDRETNDTPLTDSPDRLENRPSQTIPPGLERVEIITPAEPVMGEVPPEILEAILADLIKQTGATRQDIQMVRAEAVVWNDGSLGCPKPGEFYIQILVNGYWVVVQVEGVEYDYRVSDSGHFKLCEEKNMPPNNPPDTGGQAQNPLVSQAKEDLAERLNVPVEDIKLLSFDEVVWPDASLGCPQPGMAYLQVPQDFTLIRLGVNERMYFYHSGEAQVPFLCTETSQVVPRVTPKTDEFLPPPGSEID